MRKSMSIVICFILSVVLSSCTHKQSVQVLIPSGGPALGMIQMIHNVASLDNYKISYEVTDAPDTDLPAAITSESHQIVIAPTNLGANLYNKDSGYVYAGAVTFGNLYLVSNDTSKTYTINDLNGKTIAAFGEGAVPGILLEKILTAAGYAIVDQIDSSSIQKQVVIHYFDSVADVVPQLLTNTVQFALLAEPVLSVSKTKDAKIYTVCDIQEAYKELLGSDFYPQAGIFINESFAKSHTKFIQDFLADVKTSTEFANNHPDEAAGFYAAATDLIASELPQAVLQNAEPRSNIRFESAADSKAALTVFLQMVYDFNPAAIGNKMPDAGFYWNA